MRHQETKLPWWKGGWRDLGVLIGLITLLIVVLSISQSYGASEATTEAKIADHERRLKKVELRSDALDGKIEDIRVDGADTKRMVQDMHDQMGLPRLQPSVVAPSSPARRRTTK